MANRRSIQNFSWPRPSPPTSPDKTQYDSPMSASQMELKLIHLRRDSVTSNAEPATESELPRIVVISEDGDRLIEEIEATPTTPQSPDSLEVRTNQPDPVEKCGSRRNDHDQKDFPAKAGLSGLSGLIKLKQPAATSTLRVSYHICRAEVLETIRSLDIKAGDAGCGILVCESGHKGMAGYVRFSISFEAGSLPKSKLGLEEVPWMTRVTCSRIRGSRRRYRGLAEVVMKRLREVDCAG